jgi:N-acetyl sugar amidotransferase
MNEVRPMLQCRRCLYTSSHALGLTFDDEGICSGCRIHEEKDRLDWSERWARLEALVRPYRSTSGRTYDCIVPVTGAHDSHFIVHVVKERLGLNPLLVTYNKYFNTSLGIRNLANLRIRFDCDILVQNVNPVSVKKITRTTLREMGSMYWPCLAGQTVFPVQTAVRYKVPLIIWGAHQGLEQVGMFSHEHEVEMTRRYRKDHDLIGREADDLVTLFDTLRESDIWQFRYPEDTDLHAVGVRGIYLGNYIRWDPLAQHRQMVLTHGYQGAAFGRSFDTFDHVDCWNFLDLHDEIKRLKHGYGKVTDHACREIRHGRLTRAQGAALVLRHSAQPARHADLFCEWLGVDPGGLQFVLDRHRNPLFWQQPSPGRFEPTPLLDAAAREALQGAEAQEVPDIGLLAHRALDGREGRRYIVVGKGYPL